MKDKIKNMSKTASLLFCGLGYIAALLTAVVVVHFFHGKHVILAVAAADLFATIVIFIFSYLSDNSSFYDPYWSVAPVPIVLYLAFSQGNLSPRGVLVLILVLAWASRLTWNWMRRWKGFKDEDYRYADFRKPAGKWYWPLSFTGFHLFPTILVFLALLPVFPGFQHKAIALNIADLVAVIVAAGAIAIEALADRQLWLFRKESKKKGRLLDIGLWSWSRHPNYFGEIMFWCGLFIFSAAAGSFHMWMLAGPLAIIALFTFVSVPMADKRMMIGRPGFKERMKSVTALVPLPPQYLKKGEKMIPLSKKPLDIVILGYLLFNLLFVSYVISLEQIAIPGIVVLNPSNFTYPAWPPKPAIDVIHWWEGHFDPLLLDRPAWYKATIWIDVLLFGPFTFAAAYAFIRRRNWIRLPAVIYSAVMFTNVFIIMSEEIWGPFASAKPAIPVLANMAWFVFPFIIIARMWRNDHPFTERAGEK